MRFHIARIALPAMLTAVAGLHPAASVLAHDEFESHHAHEHGVATLGVAIEQRQLDIILESPAINVLGFEHSPRAPAEKETAAKALARLSSSDLFGLTPAAGCAVVSVLVSPPGWETAGEHADYDARYRYECSKPLSLKAIEVRLFDVMQPGTRIRARIVTAAGQSARELTAADASLPLR